MSHFLRIYFPSNKRTVFDRDGENLPFVVHPHLRMLPQKIKGACRMGHIRGLKTHLSEIADARCRQKGLLTCSFFCIWQRRWGVRSMRSEETNYL
ncbi:hypothetical protein CDAR_540351 [Caerostris darwini]|uniref:Uncharacterized protein n=1 Tax=Caerostris darwini TaxID=1538125 RepID=A0AAV4WVK5_9ARAC|nr:hypothetical protein CDAR_540351 [Caerostris darwini]